MNQTRSTTSKQPYTPDAPKTNAFPETCKPTKAPSIRKKRSRSVAAKDRSPLVGGDARIFSPRTGQHWMDGYLSLTDLDRTYMRPWDDCIPSHELSLDNLPPFFVRLRDDQVGELLEWLDDSTQKTLSRTRVNQCWPHDIAAKAWFVPGRESWGKPSEGKFALPGGPAMPSYIDMGLPPTFMSSGKAMHRDTEPANHKRKAGEPPSEKVDRDAKRVCKREAAPQTTTPEDVVQAFVDKTAALKASHKSKIDTMTADNASKEACIAELQRQIAQAIINSDAHVDTLFAKSAELETLTATLQDQTKLATGLESSLTESRTLLQTIEAKHKRQGSELQTLRRQYAEECQRRSEKKREVRDTRRELKDANARLAVLRGAVEQAKSYEEGRDDDIALRDDRIEALQARLDRGKAALERCREIVQKELRGIEGGD